MEKNREPIELDSDKNMEIWRKKGKEVEKCTVARAKMQKHLWEKIREGADISGINDKILSTIVPNLT